MTKRAIGLGSLRRIAQHHFRYRSKTMTSTTSPIRFLTAVALMTSAVLLAGCGSDTTSTKTTTEQTTTTMPRPATTSTTTTTEQKTVE
jgi:hypothetical protein